MPSLDFTTAKFDRAKAESRYPGMTFASHLDATVDTYRVVAGAVKGGSEAKIHVALEKYPEYLSFALESTGHHGMWYRSKPQIRPPLLNREKGHIPDFLVCGRNSFGAQWFVVELKGAHASLFNKSGSALSTEANHGLVQLIQYVDYINGNLPTLQSTLKIPDLTPVSGLLLIGTETETEGCEVKRHLKGALIRHMQNMQIASYSRILRNACSHLHHSSTNLG